MTATRRAARVAAIGVDGGGTKTDAVLVTAEGQLLDRVRGGASNYQGVGRAAAQRVLVSLVERLSGSAADAGVEVAAAAYGLAGVDRPADEAVFEAILAEAHPAGVPYDLVNDTFLILRAGAPDGVGVAVVSGTGSNCVGVGRDGRRDRIGGLGWHCGDDGAAGDIGFGGLRSAFRGEDGRGPTTRLAPMIRERLGLQRLDDVVDRLIADERRPLDGGLLAPLVFEAAAAGDEVALDVLRAAGRDLGLSARIVASRLFDPDDEIALVMGGSVLQKGRCDAMREALVATVRRLYDAARPIVLDAPPCLGAALLALDLAARRGAAGWPDATVAARLTSALGDERGGP